jgi:hypothetical protein
MGGTDGLHATDTLAVVAAVGKDGAVNSAAVRPGTTVAGAHLS